MYEKAVEELGRTPTYADVIAVLSGEDSDPPSGALATLVVAAFIAEVRRNWLTLPVNYFFLDMIRVDVDDYTMEKFLAGGGGSLHPMAHSAPPPLKQVFGKGGEDRDPLLRMYGGRPATTVYRRELAVFGAWLSRLHGVDEESETAATVKDIEYVAPGDCPKVGTVGGVDILIEIGKGRLQKEFKRFDE